MKVTLELRYETNKQILDFLKAYFTQAENKENLVYVSGKEVKAVIAYEDKFPIKLLDTLECALDMTFFSEGAEAINTNIVLASQPIVKDNSDDTKVSEEGVTKDQDDSTSRTLVDDEEKYNQLTFDWVTGSQVVNTQETGMPIASAGKAAGDIVDDTIDESDSNEVIAGKAMVAAAASTDEIATEEVVANTGTIAVATETFVDPREDADPRDVPGYLTNKQDDTNEDVTTPQVVSDDEDEGEGDKPIIIQGDPAPTQEEIDKANGVTEVAEEISVVDLILDGKTIVKESHKFLEYFRIPEIEEFAKESESVYDFIGNVTIWLEYDEDDEDLFCAAFDAGKLSAEITWQELLNHSDVLIDSDCAKITDAFANRMEGTENEGYNFLEFLGYILAVADELDYFKNQESNVVNVEETKPETVTTEEAKPEVKQVDEVDDGYEGEEGEENEPLGFAYIPVNPETIEAFTKIKNAKTTEEKVELSMAFFEFNSKEFKETDLVRKLFTSCYNNEEFDSVPEIVSNKMKLSQIINDAIKSKGGIIVKVNIFYSDFQKELG